MKFAGRVKMIIPKGFTTLTPYLSVNNSEEYIEFLVNTFDAIELGRSKRPDGTIANCQLKIGNSIMMLTEANDGLPPSKSSLYYFVDNAFEAMIRAKENGCSVIFEAETMPYGDIQGGVCDIRGNNWWISQRLVDKPYF